MSCLILMTTYNGAKYLQQQLDSIINQTYLNWTLLIRDDGSTDNTIEIISSYAKNDKRIRVIKNNTSKHGAYLNFWTLIKYSKTIEKYDYYFFADQDDIWNKKKIELMIKYASGQNSKPLMLYSDMKIIDGENICIYDSVNKIMGSGKIKGKSLFFTHGFIWGCSAMINRQLFELVPPFPIDDENINIVSHDNYYGKFALLFGQLLFYNKTLIMHRRHDSNTTGGYALKLSPLAIIKKAMLQFEKTSSIHGLVYNQTLLTIREMEKVGMKNETTCKIAEAINTGGVKGCLFLMKFKVCRKQLSRTIGIYIIMFFKTYKKYLIK